MELTRTYWTDSVLKREFPVRLIDVDPEIKTVVYRQLVETHATGLYHYGFWLCNDRAKATCLVQQTFTKVWESIDRAGQDSVSKIQLFSVLHQLYVRSCFQSAPETEMAEPGTEYIDWEQFRMNCENSSLRQALEAIPVKERELLILQLVGDFNCEEISSICGISPEIVRTRIYNVKRQLVGV